MRQILKCAGSSAGAARWAGLVFAATVSVTSLLALGQARAQTSAQPGQTATSASTGRAAQTSTVRTRKRVRRRSSSAVQTLPLETATPAASQTPQQAAAAQAQQRAADAKLLQQQQAQSDKAAAINDTMIQRAQQRQDSQQNEVRIQDAPGPAQTGIVPLAGPPTQPATTDQRIQDQPSAVPSQPSQPSNQTPPQ